MALGLPIINTTNNMADLRAGNGGAREGSGRPTKADEIQMIQKLSPLDDIAFEELTKGIKRGEFAYIKLFFLAQIRLVFKLSPKVPCLASF